MKNLIEIHSGKTTIRNSFKFLFFVFHVICLLSFFYYISCHIILHFLIQSIMIVLVQFVVFLWVLMQPKHHDKFHSLEMNFDHR